MRPRLQALLHSAKERAGDFAGVMERMRRLRAQISVADAAETSAATGTDVFLGAARFTSPSTLEVRRWAAGAVYGAPCTPTPSA